MNTIEKTITLRNGVEMPRLGLGVWQIDDARIVQTILWALEAGYRHIDTARIYKNESGVGKGIRESGIDRNKVFITTKLAVFDFFRSEKAFYESLKRLDTNYVDLYLLHWPFLNWKNAWKVLEKVYKEGKAKAIGVSNFSIKQLEDLKKLGGEIPMVNQIEISPFLTRSKLVEYCNSEKIAVEAYSPLTRAKRLEDPSITGLAKKYNKSPAQLMIRWGLQNNFIVIPKSETKNHIESNMDVFDFEISPDDMHFLNSLNENYSVLVPGLSR